MKSYQTDLGVAFLLGLVVLAIFWASPITTSTDSAWTLYVTGNILYEHRTDLDNFNPIDPIDYRIENIGRHAYYYYPIGASLFSVPLLWIRDNLIRDDFFDYLLRVPPKLASSDESVARVEMQFASIIVALTAVVMYFIGRQSLTVTASALTALIFALATSAWSTVSRALWSHAPSMLMLALTLFLILLANKRPWLIMVAGLPLAFSYVARPTNGLSILLLSLYIFLQHRRYFPGYLIAAFVVAVPFVIYNFSIYHALLPPYYDATRLTALDNFREAFPGTLFSPGRGLFVYSPIFLFSLAGMWLSLKATGSGTIGRATSLESFLIAIIVLHWLTISANLRWWGGISYGPRLFADMVPYLTFFLSRFFAHPPRFRIPMNILTGVALIACLLFSLFTNYQGATNPATLAWDWTPRFIDESPVRLWDWQNPPFLAGTVFAGPTVP